MQRTGVCDALVCREYLGAGNVAFNGELSESVLLSVLKLPGRRGGLTVDVQR